VNHQPPGAIYKRRSIAATPSFAIGARRDFSRVPMLIGVIALFVGHGLQAAIPSQVSLTLVIVEAAVLASLLCWRRIRDALGRLRGLAWPAGLFIMVLVVGLVTLTPYGVGGANPVWAVVAHVPAAVTIDKSSTLAELIKLGGLGCIFMFGALSGASDRTGRDLMRGIVLLGVVFAFGALVAFGWQQLATDPPKRLEATFLNPNTAGTFFAAILLLATPFAAPIDQFRLTTRPPPKAMLTAAAGGALGLGLLLTGSRGAFVALTLAVAVLTLFRLGRRRLGLARLGRGVLIVAGLLIIFGAADQVFERFAHLQADALVRTAIWSEHWRAVQAAPWMGYGLGSPETVNKMLLTPATLGDLWIIRAPLNVYLQWLEQAGVIGAAPMFLCIATIIVPTVRGALRRTRMRSELQALIAVDVLYLAHGATDFALEAYSMAAFWSYLLGLQFALSQGLNRKWAPKA